MIDRASSLALSPSDRHPPIVPIGLGLAVGAPLLRAIRPRAARRPIRPAPRSAPRPLPDPARATLRSPPAARSGPAPLAGPSRPAACLRGQIDIHGELGRPFAARLLSRDELA